MLSFVSGAVSDPCSGFEIFVPGRQGMAPAMNPVFRSANLIRRTVSHLFVCEQMVSGIIPPFPPNQALQLTADRSVTTPEFYERVLDVTKLGSSQR